MISSKLYSKYSLNFKISKYGWNIVQTMGCTLFKLWVEHCTKVYIAVTITHKTQWMAVVAIVKCTGNPVCSKTWQPWRWLARTSLELSRTCDGPQLNIERLPRISGSGGYSRSDGRGCSLAALLKASQSYIFYYYYFYIHMLQPTINFTNDTILFDTQSSIRLF